MHRFAPLTQRDACAPAEAPWLRMLRHFETARHRLIDLARCSQAVQLRTNLRTRSPFLPQQNATCTAAPWSVIPPRKFTLH